MQLCIQKSRTLFEIIKIYRRVTKGTHQLFNIHKCGTHTGWDSESFFSIRNEYFM